MPATKIAHPLIGKVVKYNTEDEDFFGVSRITADLGEGFLLAQRMSPHDGHDLPASHILIIAHLAHDEDLAIYDSWKAFEEDFNRYADHPNKRVVKLVPNGLPKDE